MKTSCAVTALFALSLALANPALAADCASPLEAAALETAVMQQELMVAALQCREASAYNRFVATYRPELQASDAALKAFFVRRGGEHGEAGYDTFKTKAANISALEQARNTNAFCADAHALFSAALANSGTLRSFVESRSGATNLGNICVESRPVPVFAKTDTKPQAAAAHVKLANADDAVGGVPEHSVPDIPYRRADGAPPPGLQDRQTTRDQDRDSGQDDGAPAYANEQEEAPPPPPPRYYQIRDRDYQGYGANAYGPPPGWQQNWRNYPAPPPPPPPRYGWYPNNGYYNW
jgi:hypothetical protein